MAWGRTPSTRRSEHSKTDRDFRIDGVERETQPKRALNSARRFHSTDEDHFSGTKFVHESPLGVETSKCCYRRGPAQG